MTSPSQVAVKYVLYSHYTYREKEDFQEYQAGNAIEKLSGLQHLERHFRGLRELLTAPGHEGLLVLFYSPGFEDYLDAKVDDPARGVTRSREQLLSAFERLRFGAAVATCVRDRLLANDLHQRVRFVTPLDLEVILGRVNAIFADSFQTYFVGPSRVIRYDTPKLVEAILRLRLLGNGVPVLRLDHDVIFRFEGNDRVSGDLGLFKAVACALRAYHLRLAKPTVATFLFSASYNSRDLADHAEPDRFKAWSRAFATRVYPALAVDSEAIREECRKKEEDQNWNRYLEANLDENLAKRFYGLENDLKTLKVRRNGGLAQIGAHPLFAVISGALLCLSEGAILDLPPFSNFRDNVMWIDDHLKYSLHRAMRHFTSGESLDIEKGLNEARLDVVVTKARPPVRNLPSYVFGTYLPTVLLGTIMDRWITEDSILKYRVRKLEPDDQDRYRTARDSLDTAVLPSAMLEALSVGHFGNYAKARLRERLEEAAVERIEEVRQRWYPLKTAEAQSFASLWAEGRVADVLPECFSGHVGDEIWKGIAPGRPMDRPLRTLSDLSGPLVHRVDGLCEDAVTYIDWTLQWPRLVQIVRSIRQGTFIGDLAWSPPPPQGPVAKVVSP